MDRLTIAYANALATSDARWAAKFAIQTKQLGRLQREQEAALKARRLTEREVAARQQAMTELVDSLAGLDAGYALEVANYRETIAALVRSADQKMLQALEQFASGERLQAMPVIKALNRAEYASKAKAVALLEQQMMLKGEATMQQNLQSWEEVVAFAPQDAAAHRQVGVLHFMSGSIAKSRVSFEAAGRNAASDRERAEILCLQSHVIAVRGAPKEAESAMARCVDAVRLLGSSADPILVAQLADRTLKLETYRLEHAAELGFDREQYRPRVTRIVETLRPLTKGRGPIAAQNHAFMVLADAHDGMALYGKVTGDTALRMSMLTAARDYRIQMAAKAPMMILLVAFTDLQLAQAAAETGDPKAALEHCHNALRNLAAGDAITQGTVISQVGPILAYGMMLSVAPDMDTLRKFMEAFDRADREGALKPEALAEMNISPEAVEPLRQLLAKLRGAMGASAP